MKILFENEVAKSPRVSVILLDWSCRESFHSLDYFANQNIPRDQYEIIWIEYYQRVSSQIEQKLKACEQSGKPPVIDQWIVMEIPGNIYYHKHLMYNSGILAGKGDIIVICDSDAMVKPTFIESIIKEFDFPNSGALGKTNIVLHLDEVRNTNKKYYPFNYPTFADVISEGCVNWVDGKTKGLWDEKDSLHSRNYGACMAARKESLIAIGGADEHVDYLGHICGPYEMTFRLVSNGSREVWHQKEFLFHTWHPGSDGSNNYLGPHDGKNISSTALLARYQGRVFPLQENPSIKALRLGGKPEDKIEFLFRAVSDRNLDDWDSVNLEMKKPSLFPQSSALGIVINSFKKQCVKFWKKPKTPKILMRGIFINPFLFLIDTIRRSNQEVTKCQKCLDEFQSNGIAKFAVLRWGRAGEMLHSLSRGRNMQILKIFDKDTRLKFNSIEVFPVEELHTYEGRIVIGSFDDVEESIKIAQENGVESERISVIC